MHDSDRPKRNTAVMSLPPDLTDDRRSGAKQGTLMVLVGTQMGAAFAVNAQATLIGRNPRAHVALDDDGISRNQARIFHKEGLYELEDMDSTNGTYVDGKRVDGRVLLHDGSRIQIGKTVLRFAMQDALEWEASKRVYEASVRDGLTGAFNRRYFEERLISEFAFAVRHGTALCVLLTDVDHFKRVNDRWGHPAGDHVLRCIGSELRSAARVEDVVARFGGEEFAILARGIDPAGAHAFAERLRVVLERAQIEWEGQRIAVTGSIGFAHNHAGAAAADPQRLVAAADKALYAAKAGGRNRVEAARSPGRYAVAKANSPAPDGLPDPKQPAWTSGAARPDKPRETGNLPLSRMRRAAKTSKLE
jgi:two-component system, cell cycle response regulator